MDFIKAYWAQVALVVSLVITGLSLYFNYRMKKIEVQYSTITKLRFDLSKEYVLAFSNAYMKLNTVSSQLFIGSWDEEYLKPVLESYNQASIVLTNASQLLKFSFDDSIKSQVDEIEKTFRNATTKINSYIHLRKAKGDRDGDVTRRITDEYSNTIDKVIPVDLPRLRDELFQRISQDLKLRKYST
jgi:hypothetical protein